MFIPNDMDIPITTITENTIIASATRDITSVPSMALVASSIIFLWELVLQLMELCDKKSSLLFS